MIYLTCGEQVQVETDIFAEKLPQKYQAIYPGDFEPEVRRSR
jgi:hypothetical protein